MRGMVVGEGGRSSGVLLYLHVLCLVNGSFRNCTLHLMCRFHKAALL